MRQFILGVYYIHIYTCKKATEILNLILKDTRFYLDAKKLFCVSVLNVPAQFAM